MACWLPKVKMSKFGDVLRKLVLLNRFKDWSLGEELPAPEGYGGLGAKPPAAGKFGKKIYFNGIGSHFACVQSHFKELDY